jgi:hypothetical protein
MQKKEKEYSIRKRNEYNNQQERIAVFFQVKSGIIDTTSSTFLISLINDIKLSSQYFSLNLAHRYWHI